MELIKSNFIVLNNGLKAKYLCDDGFSRKIFTIEDGSKAILLDDEEFYSLSTMGEPDCPFKREFQPKNIEIYRFEDQIISLEDWNDYFEPVMVEDMGEKQFDFYKEAWDYAASKYGEQPYQHIWSLVDGDDGKLIALNGYHKVNVLHYVVCNIPWGLGIDSDKDVYLEVEYEE